MRFRRTNVLLLLVALLFIVCIIILACIPRKRDKDPSKTYHLEGDHATTTTATTVPPSSSTTETSTTTTREPYITEPYATKTTESHTTTTESPTTRVKDTTQTTSTTESTTTEPTWVYFREDVTNTTETSTNSSVTDDPMLNQTTTPTSAYEYYDYDHDTTTESNTTTMDSPTSTNSSVIDDPMLNQTTTLSYDDYHNDTTTEISTTTTTTTEATTTPTTTTTTTEATTTTTTEATTTEYVPMTTPFPYSHCGTPQCQTLASSMLSKINYNVHPCKNFYQFACGGVDGIRVSTDIQEQKLNFLIKMELQNADSNSTVKNIFNNCYAERSEISSENSFNRISMGEELVQDMNNELHGKSLTQILKLTIHWGFTPFIDITIKYDLETEQFLPLVTTGRKASQLREYTDRSFCIRQIHNKLTQNIPVELQRDFQHCMKTDGLDAWMESIKLANSKLENLPYKQKDYERLRHFLRKIPTADYVIDDEKKYTVETVGKYLREIHLMLLLAMDPEETYTFEHVFVHDRDMVGKVLEYLEDEWNADKVYVTQFVQMLWTEHVFVSMVAPITAQSVENYCLGLVKELQPIETTQLLLPHLINSTRSHSIYALHEDSFEEETLGETGTNATTNVVLLTKARRQQYYSLLQRPASFKLAKQLQFSQLVASQYDIRGSDSEVLPITYFLPSVYNAVGLPEFVSYTTPDKKYIKMREEKVEISCWESGNMFNVTRDGKSLLIQVKGKKLQNQFHQSQTVLRKLLEEYQLYQSSYGITNDSLIWLHPSSIGAPRATLLLNAQAYCESPEWDVEKMLNGETLPAEVIVNTMVALESNFMKEFGCSRPFTLPDDLKCPLPLQKQQITFAKSRHT